MNRVTALLWILCAPLALAMATSAQSSLVSQGPSGTLQYTPYANRGEAIYCVRCDGHQTLGHTLAVIGRSDPAIHIATMMMDRYDHESVPILTNGPGAAFTEKALEVARLYELPIHDSPIASILGEEKVSLSGFELDSGERIEASRVIVSLGIVAYNELLTALGGKVDDSGKATVDENYESSVEDFFVVGDLVAGRKMQIYTAWDEAVDAADEIDRRVRRRKRAARR